MANLKKTKVGEAIATRMTTTRAHHGAKFEYALTLKISMTATSGWIGNGG